MKAIKMRIQKFSRAAVILVATVVVILTSMVVANATQTITTPNAAFISYNLAAGANSAPITPASSRSVLVMGCCTNAGGVGQVSLLRNPSIGINWVGLQATNAAATVGFSNTAGVGIVYIDTGAKVQIQTASVDTILIHNGASVNGNRTGNVTLIW